MVEPHSSNFRVITTNLLGVRILRKFTVLLDIPNSYLFVNGFHHWDKVGQELAAEALPKFDAGWNF